MTPDAIAAQLEYLAGRLRHGCGNGGCIINPPTGMGTNGACNCFPSEFAKQLLGLSLECAEVGHEWTKAKEASHD